MKLILKYTIVLCLVILNANVATATSPVDSTKPKKEKNLSFFPAPYFSYNKSIGAEFGLVPLFNFRLSKKDTISPRSLIGGMGVYTTNKSWSATAFGTLFFGHDNWRAVFVLGTGRYNFQTYVQYPNMPEGIFLNYGTDMTFFVANIKRRLVERLYLGLGFIYNDAKTEFSNNQPDKDAEFKILMFELFRDSRKNVYYPRNGTKISTQLRYIPTWLGNTKNTTLFIVNANGYIPTFKSRDVVALRAHAKAGLSTLEFQQQPVIGSIDLRGYTAGKYRGDGVLDIQGEYRWNFKNKLRLGVVGFAGLATLYGAEIKDFNWKLYPSVGGGLRFTAIPAAHINIGIDGAVGKDDWGVYFRLNEAF